MAMTYFDHKTDIHASVSDSKIVLVALVATKYVANNLRIVLDIIQQLQ